MYTMARALRQSLGDHGSAAASSALMTGLRVASFVGDFSTTPAGGWAYLWNSGGSIGLPAQYTVCINSIGVQMRPPPSPSTHWLLICASLYGTTQRRAALWSIPAPIHPGRPGFFR